MHKDILNKQQSKKLPFLKKFSKEFGLVGGTAIALQIGHRKSIDFDLFSIKEFKNFKIQKEIFKYKKIDHVFVDQKGEYTVLIDGVKLTFLYYPFKIKFSKKIDGVPMADLLTLASLKAYALSRRAKWKDYVDLYFITRDYCSFKKIIKNTEKIFDKNFNEKIFRSALAYFKDIDYSEKVDYMKGMEVSDNIIKKKLTEISLI